MSSRRDCLVEIRCKHGTCWCSVTYIYRNLEEAMGIMADEIRTDRRNRSNTYEYRIVSDVGGKNFPVVQEGR